MQNFVADSGEMGIRFVDNLLDILTSGEHSKTKQTLGGVSACLPKNYEFSVMCFFAKISFRSLEYHMSLN